MAIDRANRLCTSLAALAPVAQQPKGTIFTFVDLGPRLITVTHHDAIIGPYHRNGEQIADVMNAFRGQRGPGAPADRANISSDYLLICPDMSTTTIFMAEAPKGFYAQLSAGAGARLAAAGRRCRKNSPFRMWKVVR